ncbi:UNC93-like protein MFSD11 isoform X3 [Chiloscyllium plagiosum]|uniref:UNC93-like protein MFSD11 isoform X3 n=1 Tax=Chiloscyllium plagiosum TaxID=36176 RepID=UPI001CB7D6D9|nr:UNC93-like protein MFSD11 isoform X3 [Chiloscyllium plagiosum]
MGDRKVINVYLLGIGFMLIFTAFTTCGNIEQTVIRSLTNSSFSGSGYNSLAIIYGVFSASNLIAPSVVAVVGPKMSMVFSGVVYSGYVVSFSKPMTWSFYITSIFIGFAAAVLWTAQGNFLILNSDCTTINRNTGIFWALLQSSMLFGNLYVYLQWRDITLISDHDRSTLFIVLFVISLVGTVILLALKNIKHLHHHSEINDPLLLDSRLFKEKAMSTLDQITSEFRSMLRLFCTKNMLLLSMPIAYSGGGVFGLLCINNQFRRTSAILLGVIVHFLAFYLIFLIIPGDAPKGGATSGHYEPYLSPRQDSTNNSYCVSSPSAALVSSFLLGLGDSCFNTQLYSILGILYPQQSGPAFAIFKFVQSISAAVAFGYSNYLVLSSQLLILTTFCFIGTLSFFIVEKIEDNASGLQDF